jgi:hypothetical protein
MPINVLVVANDSGVKEMEDILEACKRKVPLKFLVARKAIDACGVLTVSDDSLA